MCASSPGLQSHHPLPKQPANIKSYTLKSKETQLAITTFKQILQSCYGPRGRPKVIQNSSGGYMTTTSSCSKLLQNLTVSKPVLKLMIAALQGHLSKFSDGGLYCGLLMATLVETSAALDVHPVLCSVINEHLMHLCLEILDSMKIPVDISNMHSMMCIIRSVIKSKPLCNLTTQELHHVSTLVLEAFLKRLPNVDSPNTNSPNSMSLSHIEILSVEGFPAQDSRVLDGVLLEATKFIAVQSEKAVIPKVHLGPREGQIRVALYDISMAGDSQDFMDVNYEFLTDINAETVVLAQMMKVAERLIQDEVGIVACQKVIHLTLKKFLKEKGVWAMDRLSRIHIDAVQKVTGAQRISTFSADILLDMYGYLTSATVVEMYNKQYVHLHNTSQSMYTLALCSRTEPVLEELKHVCNVASQMLGLILSSPVVLPGGGCTETYIANKLKQKITSVDESVLDEIGCTRAQYLTVANNFASCMETVAKSLDHDGGHQVTDPTNYHRYSLPPGVMQEQDWLKSHNVCSCGMMTSSVGIGKEAQSDLTSSADIHKEAHGDLTIGSINSELSVELEAHENITKGPVTTEPAPAERNSDEGVYSLSKKPTIVDCYSVKQNALCVAVETASMLLRIKHTLEDQN